MKSKKEIEEYEIFYSGHCNPDGEVRVPDCIFLRCKFHTNGIGCLHPMHPTNLVYLDEEG
jgi:hypothetical protein